MLFNHVIQNIDKVSQRLLDREEAVPFCFTRSTSISRVRHALAVEAVLGEQNQSVERGPERVEQHRRYVVEAFERSFTPQVKKDRRRRLSPSDSASAVLWVAFLLDLDLLIVLAKAVVQKVALREARVADVALVVQQLQVLVAFGREVLEHVAVCWRDW